MTTSQTQKSPAPLGGYVAGNATVHALQRTGTYASGQARYAKRCGSSRNDRHDPIPAPGAAITCKRCLAKLQGEKR